MPSPRAPEVEVKRVLRTSGLLERVKMKGKAKKRQLQEFSRTQGGQFYQDMLPVEIAPIFTPSAEDLKDFSGLLVSQSL